MSYFRGFYDKTFRLSVKLFVYNAIWNLFRIKRAGRSVINTATDIYSQDVLVLACILIAGSGNSYMRLLEEAVNKNKSRYANMVLIDILASISTTESKLLLNIIASNDDEEVMKEACSAIHEIV